MERNYPLESNIRFQPAVEINLPIKSNGSDSIFFFSLCFIHPALLDSQDCISLTQRQPLKIKSESVALLLAGFSSKGQRGEGLQ